MPIQEIKKTFEDNLVIYQTESECIKWKIDNVSGYKQQEVKYDNAARNEIIERYNTKHKLVENGFNYPQDQREKDFPIVML